MIKVICSNASKMMDDMMERLNGTVMLVAEPPTQLPVVVTRTVLNEICCELTVNL